MVNAFSHAPSSRHGFPRSSLQARIFSRSAIQARFPTVTTLGTHFLTLSHPGAVSHGHHSRHTFSHAPPSRHESRSRSSAAWKIPGVCLQLIVNCEQITGEFYSVLVQDLVILRKLHDHKLLPCYFATDAE